MCSKATSDKIMTKLCEFIEKRVGISNQIIINELSERIKRDKNLEDLIVQKISNTVSADEKISLIGILKKSSIINKKLLDWYFNEIGRQRKMTSPEIGYDITEDRYKSVIVSILDTLN
jgi:hypothetical protein